MKAVFAHDHWFIRSEVGYHDKGGLPEVVLQRYASTFGNLQVICRARPDNFTKLPKISDPRIQFLPVPNIRSVRGMASLPRVSRHISQIISEADVLIARLPSTNGLIAAHAARQHGVLCLIEVVGHAREANILHGSPMGKLAGPIEHRLMRDELRKANQAIYITEHYLQSVYPCNGRSFVCPNVAVRPVRKNHVQLRPNGTNRTIGLVGSLDVSYKGHDTALKILAQLVRNYGLSNVSIQFLGNGDPTRWQAQAAALGIADKVSFLGGLPPGEAVLSWMDGVDLFLQPSLTEGQGRSIIEAMSRGRPVVASNVGGIPELLEKSVIFAPDDVPGLTAASHKILTDDDDARARMQHNLKAASRFDVQTVEERRQSIFEELAAVVRSRTV